jgi:hypothetical protein
MTTKKIEAAKIVFAAAAEKFAALSNSAVLQLETCAESESAAIKKIVSANATHSKYCAVIAAQSDAVFQLMLDQKVSLDALATSSRELKKRAVLMLQALASKRAVDDRAFDSVLLRLASKRESKLTVSQMQHEMQHKTDTQASYFKTFCEFFNFATYNKSEKVVTFNYDAYYLSELIKVYSV